jgi:hypothetical protein
MASCRTGRGVLLVEPESATQPGLSEPCRGHRAGWPSPRVTNEPPDYCLYPGAGPDRPDGQTATPEKRGGVDGIGCFMIRKMPGMVLAMCCDRN